MCRPAQGNVLIGTYVLKKHSTSIDVRVLKISEENETFQQRNKELNLYRRRFEFSKLKITQWAKIFSTRKYFFSNKIRNILGMFALCELVSIPFNYFLQKFKLN